MHVTVEPPFSTVPNNTSSLIRTEENTLWGPKRDTLLVVVPISVVYAVILVSGVIGNVSTCIVIARNKHMHTATNYYLFSLAVSDLLLLVFGLPQEMYHIWSNYPYVFGEAYCVVAGFAAETSTNATVLTITAFTVERYVAICHPFLSHTVSKLSRAVKFVVAIWLMALCLAVPQAIQMGLVYELDSKGQAVSEELKICGVKNQMIPFSFGISTVLFFLTPMTLITVLYVLIGLQLRRSTVVTQRRAPPTRAILATGGDHCGDRHLVVRGSQRSASGARASRRVVKMLVAVVVAFFVCWAPFQAQRLYAIYAFAGEDTSQQTILVYKTLSYTSGLLYFLSTAINPILYNIMSLKFREAFKSTLSRCIRGSGSEGRVESSVAGLGGGSLGAGRFNYSVLSRNNHTPVNNSCSSGNSYAEAVPDLTRRPLVVSFRRRSARTSCSSLEGGVSPDRHCPYLTDLLEASSDTGMVQWEATGGRVELRSLDAGRDVEMLPRVHKSKEPPGRIPRVEDIEIFQESQLRIQRSVRTKRPKKTQEAMAQSCSPLYKGQPPPYEGEKADDTSHYVRKSFTVPCFMLN